ncbi:MAG: flippase-like domain-containing protein [Bacteroidales bacterium]|nr:flippase-like domain-containing protein [Bacteroidales bacterium]
MKKWAINISKYLIFLAIGIIIFWFIYKDLPIKELKNAFQNINYFWIAVSLMLSILSQISRAIRWNMLIRPMGYKPRFYNTFLSVLVLYFINLLAPRAGEVARCTVLSRYEKIPFSKLIGTVFVERLAETITLVLVAILIIISQLGIFVRFFDVHPEMKDTLTNLLSIRNISIGVAGLIIIVFLYIITRRFFRKKSGDNRNKLIVRLRHIKYDVIEGIKSIMKLENKWYFIGHTLFIFLMWLLMLYVIFLAYEPTKHLSLWSGMIVFLMGGLAMLAPVQGGIGPWHFMVYETLFIYGIDKAQGKIFALIAHTTTNIAYYLIFGMVALILLPVLNNSRAARKAAQNNE